MVEEQKKEEKVEMMEIPKEQVQALMQRDRIMDEAYWRQIQMSAYNEMILAVQDLNLKTTEKLENLSKELNSINLTLYDANKIAIGEEESEETEEENTDDKEVEIDDTNDEAEEIKQPTAKSKPHFVDVDERIAELEEKKRKLEADIKKVRR